VFADNGREKHPRVQEPGKKSPHEGFQVSSFNSGKRSKNTEQRGKAGARFDFSLLERLDVTGVGILMLATYRFPINPAYLFNHRSTIAKHLLSKVQHQTRHCHWNPHNACDTERTLHPTAYRATVESGLIQTVAKLEVGKISVGLYYMWKK